MARSRPRRLAPGIVSLVIAAALASPATAVGDLEVGRRALATGDFAAARKAFEAAIEASPRDGDAWLGLTAAAEGAGDATGALRAARRAVEVAAARGEAHHALGRALLRAGQAPAALESLSNCRQRRPTEVGCYLLAAVTLRDAERTDEAIDLLNRGVEEVPAATAGRLASELALLLLDRGEAVRALEIAETSLRAEPEDGDRVWIRALALAALGERADDAETAFERALELGVEQEGPARVEYARLLGEAGRWREAAEQLRRAAEELPEDAQVYFRLATALRQAGEVEGAAVALADYQRLDTAKREAERRERELGTALNEAQELANQNRLAEAWERLDAAAEGGDGEPRFWILRSKLLYARNRAEDARLAAGKAVALDPHDLEAVHLLAAFSLATGRVGESIAAAEHLLTLAPSFGEGWAVLGSALARDVQLEAAVAAFDRALGVGFDSPNLRRDYAGVLSDLGRLDESRVQLEAMRRLLDRNR